jgi:serine/threonine protein kinase
MHARNRQDPLLGSVLRNYRIEALIGEGAAARVYRARHVFLDRLSAVKLLSATSASTAGLRARFEREARALATMSHPNVVSVFDFGFSRDGRPFLAMELLSGTTLREALLMEGPLERWRIMGIARQIASGLAEAHRHRIVHRDLKPANIMLLGQGTREKVKILDFGVARASGRSEKELTGLEVIIGTPRYMAPEQVMNPSKVSPASDLYSLGVVLYEMLSGRAPFEGGTIHVLDQQMNHEPPPLTTTTGLERLVDQLLEKDPGDRPPDAETVIKTLELMPDDQPTQIEMFAVPADLIEEATVRDEVPCVRPLETLMGETAPGIAAEETIDGLISPTLMVEQCARPKQEKAPVARAAPLSHRPSAKRDRLAAVLACIALVLGCSVVALAAVSVQRRLEPRVIVVSHGDRP